MYELLYIDNECDKHLIYHNHDWNTHQNLISLYLFESGSEKKSSFSLINTNSSFDGYNINSYNYFDITIKPGEYILVPTTFKLDINSNFSLTVFSNADKINIYPSDNDKEINDDDILNSI